MAARCSRGWTRSCWPDRPAERAAQKYGLTALSVDDLLARDDIDLVINLTPPLVHAEICQRALTAGKHIHTEKPLATDRAAGLRTLALADERGLRVGAAPDTFLGAGAQTCRSLIDSGAIGEPLTAVAFMLGSGPEPWHPDPEFLYKRGGAPYLHIKATSRKCVYNLLPHLIYTFI